MNHKSAPDIWKTTSNLGRNDLEFAVIRDEFGLTFRKLHFI